MMVGDPGFAAGMVSAWRLLAVAVALMAMGGLIAWAVAWLTG
jgi:hypothetical protein